MKVSIVKINQCGIFARAKLCSFGLTKDATRPLIRQGSRFSVSSVTTSTSSNHLVPSQAIEETPRGARNSRIETRVEGAGSTHTSCFSPIVASHGKKSRVTECHLV